MLFNKWENIFIYNISELLQSVPTYNFTYSYLLVLCSFKGELVYIKCVQDLGKYRNNCLCTTLQMKPVLPYIIGR